jgi:hypothetical protein
MIAPTPWRTHNGGPCPVHPDAIVDIRTRGGPDELAAVRMPARAVIWAYGSLIHETGERLPKEGEVLAYRVVDAPPAVPAYVSPPSMTFRLETGKGDEITTIPMLLTCPACGARHIDEGDFAEVPHHTHACQKCGCVWRPAKVNTHGVQFLPGYRNAETTA